MDFYKDSEGYRNHLDESLYILHFAKEVIPQKGEELTPFDETENYFPGASYVGKIWAKLHIDEKKLIELYKQETAKKEYPQDMKTKLVLRILRYLIGDKIDFKEHWQSFSPYAEMVSAMKLEEYEESFARPMLIMALGNIPYLIPDHNRMAMTTKSMTFEQWKMKLANSVADVANRQRNFEFERYLRIGQWKNAETSLDWSVLK